MNKGTPEKMILTSMDIAGEKRAQLRRLFPEAFGEGGIDFEQLRRALGDWVAPGKERYGLSWPGKADCMRVIQAPSIATLKPDRKAGVNFDATQNVFIEGDNLEVLKLLQKAYFGKVKMIYIDPPYNTGKEFIYPDKYQENLATYLAYTGQTDGEGRAFATNTEAGGRYHANWLNMIYPRLYLARNLLRDDGVIFISIDDNEQANLKKVCDEIFGAENFVGNVAWKKTSGDNKPSFAFTHDSILIYTKSLNTFPRTPLSQDQKRQYKNPDNDPKGYWAESDYRSKWSKSERPNLYYGITNRNTKELIFPDTFSSSSRVWGYEEKTHIKNEKLGLVWWGLDGKAKEPRKKRYLSEHKGANTRSLWLDAGTNDNASQELRTLLNGNHFDNPKPVSLLKRIIGIVARENDLILDFFAGSCTTAHAVMQLNAEDGGNRRCISVQLPEPCDPKSEAYKEGYKNIAEIGKERMRRAGQKIAAEQEGGALDVGFKAFKLDRSNFAPWEGDAAKIDDLAAQLAMHVDHINGASSAEDILYEVLLKAGFELATQVERRTMAGKAVYAVDDGALLICLDRAITPALIDALAEADPQQVICLDAGFAGNDQLKVNAVHTFKMRAARSEAEIIFRTV